MGARETKFQISQNEILRPKLVREFTHMLFVSVFLYYLPSGIISFRRGTF